MKKSESSPFLPALTIQSEPPRPDLRLRLEEAALKRSTRMTSRQRVNAAIAREPVDQVPFDFWASPDQLKKLMDGMSVQDEEALYQLLGSDCRVFQPAYIGPSPIDLGDAVFVDSFGSHRTYRQTPYGTHKEMVAFPLKDARTAAQVESYPYLPRPEFWDCSGIPELISRLDAHGERHLRLEAGGIFEYSWALTGLESFLIGLAGGETEVPYTLMSWFTDLFIDVITRALEAAGGRIDMVYIYDDIGTQQGPLMSLKMWKEHLLPWQQKFVRAIRPYGVQFMYHSCGSITTFIPALISELGIDVLNPLQPLAARMDLKAIKQEFGSRLAFHGAVDIQRLMPLGSPEEVQSTVMEICTILGQGGGYICAPAHKLQADVPVENVAAMYSTPR